jgi:hypothetical protein
MEGIWTGVLGQQSASVVAAVDWRIELKEEK